MTIGKKLYMGFGLILVFLSVLFIVNIIAGFKERSARVDATAALESVRTVESVRYQIMLNRLNMNNFLLSGDPRDEEKVTKGLTDIVDLVKRGESQANSEAVRTALIQWKAPKRAGRTILRSRSWPSAIKSIPETQRFPTCKSSTCRKIPLPGSRNLPRSWIKATPELTSSRETSVSASRMSTFSTWVTTFGTLVALLAGGFIAVYTLGLSRNP